MSPLQVNETKESRLRRVSIVVPCRNERTYIESFCSQALAQELPPGWALELLIADGDSDDGGRECLEALAASEPCLRVVSNPGRIVSTGLNAAIQASVGEVIVRMDVHTAYAADYVSQCLLALQVTGADNVGGPWRAVPAAGAHAMQHAVAAAFQSRWVAGGARSRDLDYSGWVDTVYLGCWPRAVFDRYGGFDERLVRNQDDEHNLRLRRGGAKVWQDARIRSAYRPRARLTQVFRQYQQYGYWKPFVMRKHSQPASLRHLVPGVFVALFGALSLLALTGLIWPVLALGALYGLAVLALTIGVAVSEKLSFQVLVRVPAVIAAYHLGYGLGSMWGWFDVLRGVNGRDTFKTLTR